MHAYDCVLIRVNHYLMVLVLRKTMVTTENNKVLMATQSSLESFNPAAGSIEDYKKHFDFHCTAHQILEARQKALFDSNCRDTFAKLKPSSAQPR